MDTQEIVLAFTNGDNDKPYWKWSQDGETIRIYVADEQLLCIIPRFENAVDFADAICTAGESLKMLSSENDLLRLMLEKSDEDIEQLEKRLTIEQHLTKGV